ncbi:MAG TPA: hypothetical protein VK212_08650 [Lentimicrobium sp.]|nr:hypothetical protein [Lentimicrobium sp.]
MGKKLIIYFIALSALELFNVTFLGPDVIKVFQLAGIGLTITVLFVQLVYQKEERFAKHFSFEILLIFLGVILSMFMAHWSHDQSLVTTMIAQRFMYFYLVYWVLHSLKVSLEDVESIIYWLGLTYSLLYIVQFFAYPNIIFDVRIAEDRETIRIFLPGFTFLVLGYFLILNRLFESFAVWKLLSALFFLLILILMGTRQVLFSVMLLTLMYVMFSKAVKSRALIFILILASVVPLILIFQEIFISLIDLSKNQSQSLAENVRIRATVFFLSELFPNTASYITGNGADSTNSSYGFMIQMYKDAYGFYQSDIGIIGDYTKFGAFFALAVFMIIFKVIFRKVSPAFSYTKYFYISILLTLFTGGGPFGQADSIVALCFTLYILDVDRHDILYEEENLNQELELEESLLLNGKSL